MSEREADDRAPTQAPPPAVTGAPLASARNAVTRFLARGGFTGSMESLAGAGSSTSAPETASFSAGEFQRKESAAPSQGPKPL